MNNKGNQKKKKLIQRFGGEGWILTPDIDTIKES